MRTFLPESIIVAMLLGLHQPRLLPPQVGGLLSYNIIFPSDKPDIARLLGCAASCFMSVALCSHLGAAALVYRPQQHGFQHQYAAMLRILCGI